MSTDSFTLEPPAAVAAVPPESASGKIRLKNEDLVELDRQVDQFIQEITQHDSQSPEFKTALERIHSMGQRDIEAAASMSNRMLERPVSAMTNGMFDEGSGLGMNLIALRRQVEELDPSRQGDLFAPRKLLGLIPFGNKLHDYFQRYQSAQSHLNGIIESLKRGKDELMRDNAAIEQEKATLWSLMERQEKYIHIARQLDARLEQKAAEFDLSDPEKGRVVREEMLFYARQKVTDLLTQMAVNVQGYLTLDMVRKNNLELGKGVDRATTTTVAALRTAVMAAQALGNQKLVLDQVTALNTTTGSVIQGTSELLRDQSGKIQQQAASSTIDMNKLQQAFRNIYQTMDSMADFKVKALANMQTTVDTLSSEVAKAKTYLDRQRAEVTRDVLPAVSQGGSEVLL